jgi:hypothetical protein
MNSSSFPIALLPTQVYGETSTDLFWYLQKKQMQLKVSNSYFLLKDDPNKFWEIKT